MIITADGVDYDMDAGRLDMLEVMAVTEYTGLSLKDWQESLQNLNDLIESTDLTKFRCLQSVVWISRRRAGEHGPIAETNFDLTTLKFEATAAEKAEAAAAKAVEGKPRGQRAGRPTPATV